MPFQTGQISEQGGRHSNQDFCGFIQIAETACWVLADGLGGHAGGATASRMAVEAMLEIFRQNPAGSCSTEWLKESLQNVHTSIGKQSEEVYELEGMRTTIVVLVSDGKNALWAHAGDSRLYHFRNGKIVVQTKDHSIPQLMVDTGKITVDEIRGHEDQNRLLKSLGQQGDLRPAILGSKQEIVAGDVFLLCSDGLWGYILENEMESFLKGTANPQHWLEEMRNQLLKRATGSYDNYTAIAVFV